MQRPFLTVDYNYKTEQKDSLLNGLWFGKTGGHG